MSIAHSTECPPPLWDNLLCRFGYGENFGCGTGRITLPLARQGVDVTGMNASIPTESDEHTFVLRAHDGKWSRNSAIPGLRSRKCETFRGNG